MTGIAKILTRVTRRGARKNGAPGKRGRAGFTLMETLLCLFIMVLFTLILTRIMETATNAYTKVVDNTNADVLLSTTMTFLRDELGTARNVVVSEDGKKISYDDGYTGAASEITTTEDGFTNRKYGKTTNLVTATNDLVAVCERFVDSEGDITVEGLAVGKAGAESTYTGIDRFVINKQ